MVVPSCINFEDDGPGPLDRVAAPGLLRVTGASRSWADSGPTFDFLHCLWICIKKIVYLPHHQRQAERTLF